MIVFSNIRRIASYYIARAPVHVYIASSMGVNLVLISPAVFIIFRNAQDKIPKGRAAQIQPTGRPHNSARTRLKTTPAYTYIEGGGGGNSLEHHFHKQKFEVKVLLNDKVRCRTELDKHKE
jgi:hypothetical protein